MYHIVGSLTLNSPRTHTWTKLLWHMCFLHEHITAFLSWGALESKHFNTTLGATLNSETTNKKTQKCRKHDTKWAMKRTLGYSLRAKTRKPSSASAGNVRVRRSTLLPLCTHPWMTTKVLQALIWELYVNSSEQENSQTQRLGIMNINSVWWGFVRGGEWLEGC